MFTFVCDCFVSSVSSTSTLMLACLAVGFNLHHAFVVRELLNQPPFCFVMCAISRGAVGVYLGMFVWVIERMIPLGDCSNSACPDSIGEEFTAHYHAHEQSTKFSSANFPAVPFPMMRGSPSCDSSGGVDDFCSPLAKAATQPATHFRSETC